MLLQLKASMPGIGDFDVIAGCTPDEASRLMNGEGGDFNGNASFATGAAVLLPYANRVSGRLIEEQQAVEKQSGPHRAGSEGAFRRSRG